MICPHCSNTIEEQDQYTMSARCEKDDPELIRRRRLVMAYLIGFLIAVVAFAELTKYIH